MNTVILPYILLLWQIKLEFAKYCLKMESKSIVQIASKELHLKWQHLLVGQICFCDFYQLSRQKNFLLQIYKDTYRAR